MSRWDGKTVRDGAREWIATFNAIDQDIIRTLMKYAPDEWREVTLPSTYQRVYVYNLPEHCESTSHSGEIVGHSVISDEEDNVLSEYWCIALDDGEEITLDNLDDVEIDFDYTLPMWGTMWSFGDMADKVWLEERGGLQIMSNCGFRIYQHDEWGYFFGIDGAGYDFYEAHWEPLYIARGLKWHDETKEAI